MHVNYGSLLGYFKANPFHTQNIKVFGKSRPEYFSLILPYNSPLKPILQKSTNEFIETGTAEYLLKKWEGKGIPVNDVSAVTVLSAGQVLLVFVIIIFTFGLAGLVLCLEVSHKYFKDILEKSWILDINGRKLSIEK